MAFMLMALLPFILLFVGLMVFKAAALLFGLLSLATGIIIALVALLVSSVFADTTPWMPLTVGVPFLLLSILCFRVAVSTRSVKVIADMTDLAHERAKRHWDTMSPQQKREAEEAAGKALKGLAIRGLEGIAFLQSLRGRTDSAKTIRRAKRIFA